MNWLPRLLGLDLVALRRLNLCSVADSEEQLLHLLCLDLWERGTRLTSCLAANPPGLGLTTSPLRQLPPTPLMLSPLEMLALRRQSKGRRAPLVQPLRGGWNFNVGDSIWINGPSQPSLLPEAPPSFRWLIGLSQRGSPIGGLCALGPEPPNRRRHSGSWCRVVFILPKQEDAKV